MLHRNAPHNEFGAKAKLNNSFSKFTESVPYVVFFAILFFTINYFFGVADALLGIAILFFSRTIVKEPGLSFGNYVAYSTWFFVMALCASMAGLHPVAMLVISPIFLFVTVMFTSDDYLPRNFYWFGMGYLLLLVYPVSAEDIAPRMVATLASVGFTTLFVFGMRAFYEGIGKIHVFNRDREFVRRSFDYAGSQLLAVVQAIDGADVSADKTAGTEGDARKEQSYTIAQEYARLEYGTVYRQGGLLSGRQAYTFALLLCCEQVTHLANATLRNMSQASFSERSYFQDLADLFLDFGRGNITSVSQLVKRLRSFVNAHSLQDTCTEESWSGVLEATVRMLEDSRMARSNSTPFWESVKYRLKYVRENIGLGNTHTRFALQLSVIVGIVGMGVHAFLIQNSEVLFSIWVPITAFAVLNTYNDETLKSTFNNTVGTVLGIAAFVLVVHFIPLDYRLYVVAPLSYLIILMNFNQTTNVLAGTQMALTALYPFATLSATVLYRLVFVIVAVSCVIMVVFVFMRTRRTATIHARVREMERIDVRLVKHIHASLKRGHVDMWHVVRLLYYMHMDSWLMAMVSDALGQRASLGKRKRKKEDAKLDELRRSVDKVLAMNYRFAMEAEHAAMLLDPRRRDSDESKEQGSPDTTARIRHIDATAERLDEKIHSLESLHYLGEDTKE